jgi:hypothetical protein
MKATISPGTRETGNCFAKRQTANIATSKVGKGHQGWELLGGNLNLAYGAFPSRVGVLENIEIAVHIIVVVNAFDYCTCKSSRKEEETCCQGGEVCFDRSCFREYSSVPLNLIQNILFLIQTFVRNTL